MPRTAGLSGSTVLSPIRSRPRARTVPRAAWLVLTVLLRRVTRSLPAIDGLRGVALARDVHPDRLAAAGRQLLRALHRAQALERGSHHVHRVRRAERLGQDVAHPGRL